jgi:hypothetical protein
MKSVLEVLSESFAQQAKQLQQIEEATIKQKQLKEQSESRSKCCLILDAAVAKTSSGYLKLSNLAKMLTDDTILDPVRERTTASYSESGKFSSNWQCQYDDYWYIIFEALCGNMETKSSWGFDLKLSQEAQNKLQQKLEKNDKLNRIEMEKKEAQEKAEEESQQDYDLLLAACLPSDVDISRIARDELIKYLRKVAPRLHSEDFGEWDKRDRVSVKRYQTTKKIIRDLEQLVKDLVDKSTISDKSFSITVTKYEAYRNHRYESWQCSVNLLLTIGKARIELKECDLDNA